MRPATSFITVIKWSDNNNDKLRRNSLRRNETQIETNSKDYIASAFTRSNMLFSILIPAFCFDKK